MGAARSKPEPETRPAAAEAMGAWRFSTADYPRAERRDAWREVLSRLRLPLGEPPRRTIRSAARCRASSRRSAWTSR